jgi:hypothetical protein
MNRIAVYDARRPFTRVRFELYEDSVRASGSRNGLEFDTTIPLARISSQSERFWVYGLYYYVGFFVVLIAVALLLAFVALIDHDRPTPLARPYSLIGGLGVVGLVLVFMNSRKIEYARFRNDAGVPVLDIPRNRGDAEEFIGFTGLLAQAVSKVRRESLPYRTATDEL